ncbi:MAG: SgcJ/EcaC family oxidoreductase [Candidatus Hydrogenedentes bacterium]|nr:SgcJ/EcaC family oxidoreductase [Candidatus Hydrogenedentota bacterium]
MNQSRTTQLFILALIVAVGTIFALERPMFGATESNSSRLSKADEDAVRAVVMGIEQTWNSHDMDAMGKLFRDDAEFINVVGMDWHGRNAIMVAHSAYHNTMFKNHNIKTDTIETRSIADGCAIAVVTTTNDSFKTPDGNVVPKRQNRQTYVLTKRADGWKIVHAHNVPVDAMAAQHDPAKAPK